MKKIIILLVGILMLTNSVTHSQNKESVYSLIPKPLNIELEKDSLWMPINISVSEDFSANTKELLIESLKSDLNVVVSETKNEDSFIRLKHDLSLSEEAYKININAKNVEVAVSSPAGELWAIQSLKLLIKQQALYFNGEDKFLFTGTISDEPRYSWRGFHLDVARHFFNKDYLKRLIDNLSFYKINKLHLHLNDDQGWRIEIDKYPLLIEIGAWRELDKYDSLCIKQSKFNAEMKLDERCIRNDSQFGSFYTKSDIREIIAHAQKLGIEVIPEIDMPGHMSSAIKAYPFLSCAKKAGWGKEFTYPICPCDGAVIEFAKDIYAEIADLFPSQYIHIGADEVEKDTWETSSTCKAFMKKYKLKSTVDLQTYYVHEMQQFLESKGKKVIAWDDVADGAASNRLIVTYWRHWLKENPKKVKDKGHPMIFTSWIPFYLSNTPTLDMLKHLYGFDIAKEYPGMDASHLIGYQTCIWTEHIPTEAKLDQHIYPALQAFSEVAWGSDRKWNDFVFRLRLHERIMDRMNIGYTAHDYK